MTSDLSSASQNYLKAIHTLTARFGRATTSQIAEQLAIKPASVTSMMQKMAQAEPPLVAYEKHQGVTLTPAGEKAALEMIRHHRLLELFLHEKLGYAWDEVHEEADRLEHVISEDMERRMAEILGDPKCDPHGQPIPTRDLELLPTADCPLSELRPGQQAIVRRVRDEDPSLLRYLDRLGLRPQARLKVIDYVSFDRNLRLQVAGQAEAIVVGAQVADYIFVEALPEL